MEPSNDYPSTELAIPQGRAIQPHQHETTTAHSAALAKAEVEARFAIAAIKPRSMDEARVRLLTECKRPGFAQAARYSKPVGGKKIEGPSIRFAEAAIRSLGNIDTRTPTVFEDAEKRVVRVTCTDLESNTTYSTDVTVQKTVERKKLAEGQQPISIRQNSYGDTVYLVPATDDDLLNKQNALISKAVRTLALRLLPGDIVDECMALVQRVAHDRSAADPTAARKALVDAFAAIGVKPTDLERHLGHGLDACSPAQLEDLRAMYVAIKEGEAAWKDFVDTRTAEPEDEKAKATAAKLDAVKEKIRGKKAKEAAGNGEVVDPETGEVNGGGKAAS